MALDPGQVDALMILVCAVALVILIALIAYTWVKWHQRQLNPPAHESNEPAHHGIELTGVRPTAHYQKGYLNEVGRESPNLSGSRTFLNEDVLKQKPFHKHGNAPSDFQTKDVVYHADAERNPHELLAGDVVYHANGPFDRENNKTSDGVDVGHVVFNADEANGKRRWSESMTRAGESDKVEIAHRKNTYL